VGIKIVEPLKNKEKGSQPIYANSLILLVSGRWIELVQRLCSEGFEVLFLVISHGYTHLHKIAFFLDISISYLLSSFTTRHILKLTLTRKVGTENTRGTIRPLDAAKCVKMGTEI